MYYCVTVIVNKAECYFVYKKIYVASVGYYINV